MKFCSLFLLSAPLAADAFAPLASPRRTSSSTEMNMAKNDLGLFSDIMRPFGTLAVAASLAFNPIIASAQENNVYQDSSIASSSVQVSETIKVLDMGLPSYGDIAMPKASQSAFKGVVVEPEKELTPSSSVLPTKKSGGNGNALYAAKKAKPAKKERVYVEKTAEDKERDDAKIDNVNFSDMSMPSYSDNASGAKRSKFAL